MLLSGMNLPSGLSEDLGIDRKDRVLTNVGRLRTQKGQTFLLDAMASLVSAFEGIKLLILGEGDLLPTLKRKLEALGLSNRVKFLGNRSDVPDILALTEIFVFPSLWEGTSLALLEAMAAGKPIVATDIPGNRTVLQHMKTAISGSAWRQCGSGRRDSLPADESRDGKRVGVQCPVAGARAV